jgi:hypothetical protein
MGTAGSMGHAAQTGRLRMSQLVGATKGGFPDRAKLYGIDQQAIDNKAFNEPQKHSESVQFLLRVSC